MTETDGNAIILTAWQVLGDALNGVPVTDAALDAAKFLVGATLALDPPFIPVGA